MTGRRGVPHIDYRLLNNTGIVSSLVEETLSGELSNMSIDDPTTPSNLQIDVMVLIDEINDIIDENPIQGTSTTELT